MGSSRRHAVPPPLSLAAAICVLLVVAGAAALAADPSADPSAGPVAPTPGPTILPGEVRPPGNIQAWRDSDYITPDAPPGGIVQAGFSFWDARQGDFFQPGDIYIRLHPAKGNAAPSDGLVNIDFPGHVSAGLVVPEGGPGEVEVGMLVPACIEGTGCGVQRAPFTVTGIGPPPDARPDQLIGAEILPLVGDTVVNREFPISANVIPKGDWTPDMLKLPDHLVVIARHPGGQPLSTGEIRAAGDPGTPYTGKLSIPETGDVQIVVAIPRDDGSNVELADSAIERTVIQGGRPSASPAEAGAATTSPSASTPEPAASSSGGIPPLVWIAGIGVLVVVGVVVGRRVLSDL